MRDDLAPDAVNHSPPCGGCGRPMELRQTPSGPGYRCFRCKLVHGAHPDGTPLGVPGDRATHAARREAHQIFDRLWRGPARMMERAGAYRWLAFVLGCAEADAHIGRLTAEQCAKVIEAFNQLVPALRGGAPRVRDTRTARLRRRSSRARS